MRVTDSMMFQTFLNQLERIKQDYNRYSEQISSGRRINRPSDDPLDTTKLLSLQHELAKVAKYDSNITSAQQRLNSTDSQLNEVTLALTRTVQLAEQGASDTSYGDGRAGIAMEVRAIQNQMLSLASSQAFDRYIFAGTLTTRSSIPSTPAGQVFSASATLDVTGAGTTGGTVIDPTQFTEDIYVITFTDAAGNYEVVDLDDNRVVTTGTVAVGVGSVSFEGLQIDYNLGALPAADAEWVVKPQYVYNGNDEGIELQVDENTNVVINVTGSDIFGGASGVPGGTMFDDLVDFRYNLLRDDTNAIGADLQTAQDHVTEVGRQRALIGGRIANLRSYEFKSGQRLVDLLTEKANLENVDLPEAISKLVQTEGGLSAALQTGARLGQLSLFNFLR